MSGDDEVRVNVQEAVHFNQVQNEGKSPLLDFETAQTGCGMGTPTACFALALGTEGLQCLLIASPQVALEAGAQLDFRVNRDPGDNCILCPKGVMPNSRLP